MNFGSFDRTRHAREERNRRYREAFSFAFNMAAICLVCLFFAYLFIDKAIPQAVYDSIHHEIGRK